MTRHTHGLDYVHDCSPNSVTSAGVGPQVLVGFLQKRLGATGTRAGSPTMITKLETSESDAFCDPHYSTRTSQNIVKTPIICLGQRDCGLWSEANDIDILIGLCSLENGK